MLVIGNSIGKTSYIYVDSPLPLPAFVHPISLPLSFTFGYVRVKKFLLPTLLRSALLILSDINVNFDLRHYPIYDATPSTSRQNCLFAVGQESKCKGGMAILRRPIHLPPHTEKYTARSSKRYLLRIFREFVYPQKICKFIENFQF